MNASPPLSRAIRGGWATPSSTGARGLPSPLVALALPVLCALQLTRVAAEQVAKLNSDQLYVPSLYRDLVVDRGSLGDWALPPAPSFFPDLALYATAEAMTGAVGPALILTVCAQFVLIVALAALFLRTIDASAGAPMLEVVLSATLLLVLLSDHPMRHDFFSVAHHGGTLSVGMGITVLWARTLDRWRARGGAMILVLAFLGAASDLILLPQFLLPLCIATGVLVISRRVAIAAAMRPFVALLLGLVPALGVTLGSHLWSHRAAAAVESSARPSEEGPALLQRKGSVVLGNIADLLRWMTWPFVVLLVVAVVAAGLVVRRSLRGPATPERDRALFASVFFLGCMACASCGPVLTLGGDPRYLQPTYILPALFLPWLLRSLDARLTRRLSGVTLLAALSIPAGGHVVARSFAPSSFRLPYAQSSACLDRVTEEAGMDYGFASYWSARYLGFHSRRGLLLNELTAGLEPRVWNSSRAWYARVAAAHPERVFVVSAGLPVERFAQVFGPPAAVASCSDFDVYTYDYPKLSSEARRALGEGIR